MASRTGIRVVVVVVMVALHVAGFGSRPAGLGSAPRRRSNRGGSVVLLLGLVQGQGFHGGQLVVYLVGLQGLHGGQVVVYLVGLLVRGGGHRIQ